MTRSTTLKQAGTAKQGARAAATAPGEPAAMTFLFYEDDGGCYHWAIVAEGGETFVRSVGFASYEEAKPAAAAVQRGASRASFADHPEEPPFVALSARRSVNPPARRGAVTARDRSDAERWLDEGGSFNSEAVTRCVAGR